MARNMSFISHTLSHVGFAGAAFAVFLGINPIYGLLIFTITMSYLVGHLSVKAFRREATVSVMLGIFLGLGLLFLSLTPKSTSYVNSILFGSVVSITRDDVKLIFILALTVIILLSIFYRKININILLGSIVGSNKYYSSCSWRITYVCFTYCSSKCG